MLNTPIAQTLLQHRGVSTRDVQPFLAMDILAAANAREARGLPTYHLEVGQPGAPLPDAIIKEAQSQLARAPLGYTEAIGMRALRERLSALYRERYGLDIDPSRILATTGSSAGFSLAFLLLCNPGDRVLLPRPGYPAYRNIVQALGLTPVEVDLLPENDWRLSVDQLAQIHSENPVRCLLLASPNNPTGTALDRPSLEALVSYCRSAGIWFVSDEIYHGLNFTGDDVCALSFDDDAIIINSFSKYYCMTGWRLGWMVLPERMLGRAQSFAQNLFICPPTLSQYAGLAALAETDAFEEIKAGYAANRGHLRALTRELGIADGPPADGAFYLYVPVERYLRRGENAAQLCSALLADTGVAITPGRDFDPICGDGWVRISYAGPTQTITQAADLMREWFKDRTR